jgi:hypothetical protein
MANYHLSVKAGSRSKGKSAGAKCNYISAEGRYKKKSDEVVFKKSGNMPSWVPDENPSVFWKETDRNERVDACLYREFEFSIPRELNDEQRIACAEDFVATVIGKVRPFTMAIHDKDDNPHCHLIITDRRLDGIERDSVQFFKRANLTNPQLGGAHKPAFFSKKPVLKATRKAWEETANKHLEIAGCSERITCESYASRGIDKEAEPKMSRERRRAEEAAKQAVRDIDTIRDDIVHPSEPIGVTELQRLKELKRETAAARYLARPESKPELITPKTREPEFRPSGGGGMSM